MASASLHAFVHAAYLAGGKSWPATEKVLEDIISSNFQLITDGGRVMVSSSANGRTFTYAVQSGTTPDQVISRARTAWAMIHDLTAEDARHGRAAGSSLDWFLRAPASRSTRADFSGYIG